jgi:hypothetical protein
VSVAEPAPQETINRLCAENAQLLEERKQSEALIEELQNLLAAISDEPRPKPGKVSRSAVSS